MLAVCPANDVMIPTVLVSDVATSRQARMPLIILLFRLSFLLLHISVLLPYLCQSCAPASASSSAPSISFNNSNALRKLQLFSVSAHNTFPCQVAF